MEHLLALLQVARTHHEVAESGLREVVNHRDLPVNLMTAIARDHEALRGLLDAAHAQAVITATHPGPMVSEALEDFEEAIAKTRALFVTREDAPEDEDEYMAAAVTTAVDLVDAGVRSIVGALLGIREEIAAERENHRG